MQHSGEALVELQRQQQRALETIRSEGLVTVTMPSEALSMQRQANLEFTTLENLHKHSQLALDAELERVFLLLWSLPEVKKSKDGRRLTKPGYFKIMHAIHLALQAKQNRGNVQKLIAQDYEEDLARFGEMNKQNFCRSMFELVDMWCNSLERELYAAFAWALVMNIVNPSTGALKKGKIRCILDDPDDELLSLWRESNRSRRVDGLRMDIMLRIPEVVARLKSRKKGTVLTASDARQLEALSKKMGLEYGSKGTRCRRSHYAGADNSDAVSDAMFKRIRDVGSRPAEQHLQIEANKQPENALSVTTNTMHESEILSPRAAISPFSQSLQEEFCPAITITSAMSASVTKRAPRRQSLHVHESSQQQTLHQVHKLPTLSPVRRTATREGTALYLLQERQPVAQPPLLQQPRMVQGVVNELLLCPARKLDENTSTGTLAPSDKLLVRASEPLILHRSHRQFEGQTFSSLVCCSPHSSKGTKSERENAEEEERIMKADVQENWHFACRLSRTGVGALQLIPNCAEKPVEQSPPRALSGSNLHCDKDGGLVRRNTYSKECSDTPTAHSRKRKLRKQRGVDPAVASERKAEQELALQQWYHSKDYRRLF